jgi:V/A-type H+-transporting ATPase subunit I
MCKLNVLILSKFVTPVTRALGDLGLVHLVDAIAQSREQLLDNVEHGEDIRQIEQLISRCEGLLDTLGVDVAEEPPSREHPITRQQIRNVLDTVADKVHREQDALAAMLEESGLLKRESERLAQSPVQGVPLNALRSLSHVYIQTGRLAPSLIPSAQAAIGDRGILLYDSESPVRRGNILVLAAKKNRWAIESELGKLGYREQELPEQLEGTPEGEQQHLATRLGAVREHMEESRRRMLDLALEYGGMLLAVKRQLRGSLAILRAQQRFGRSAHLYCISGWVPKENEARVRDVVDRVSHGTGVVEVIEPQEDIRVSTGAEAVPVKMPGGRLRRPFEALITNFGAPRYGELDPTIFVAISFVIMFGIMFGDIGQGAVIAVLGVWLSRTRREWARPYRDGGVLLVFCGASAVAFGFLYGSVFGYENPELLKPVWLSPLHDVTRLLKTTIVLGIVFISIAILINIVNKVRSRHYFESVFDRFGILGIIFYWGAIGIGLKAATAGELSASGILLVIVLPLALLFLREPLHNLLHRRRLLEDNPFSFVLEACIETMETLTAFLGNTVSFVRVGAFALSHAALCLAVYSIVDIIRSLPGGGIWMVLVLIVGNMLVIAMEGMVAMVQGIRLQYYELFSKYYSGDGLLYRPFSLSEQENPEQGEQQV